MAFLPNHIKMDKIGLANQKEQTGATTLPTRAPVALCNVDSFASRVL